MRTRQKCVATDTWRSLGCRTTPLEHWSRRKPTVEPRWAKQQTKKLSKRYQGTGILKHYPTLPWIPTYPYTYPYPSIVIPYPSTYPTLPTVGKIPLPTLSIYPTYPIHVTSAYIPVLTSHYLL